MNVNFRIKCQSCAEPMDVGGIENATIVLNEQYPFMINVHKQRKCPFCDTDNNLVLTTTLKMEAKACLPKQ